MSEKCPVGSLDSVLSAMHLSSLDRIIQESKSESLVRCFCTKTGPLRFQVCAFPPQESGRGFLLQRCITRRTRPTRTTTRPCWGLSSSRPQQNSFFFQAKTVNPALLNSSPTPSSSCKIDAGTRQPSSRTIQRGPQLSRQSVPSCPRTRSCRRRAPLSRKNIPGRSPRPRAAVEVRALAAPQPAARCTGHTGPG